MAKIRIQRRPLIEWLTCLLFIYPFILSFFLQFLKLPSLMKYVMDIAWFAILALTLGKGRFCIKKEILPFLMQIGIFFLYTLIVYLLNYQSAVYYLWGFRNNFRYYVAFLAFAMYLKADDARSMLKLTDTLFWINAAVTFYQFFVLGCKQDYLGGLFGVERGCNGASTVFFTLVISRSLLAYMNGQERAWSTFLKSGIALTIAAMAEIKMFFLIYAMILTLSAVFTRFSIRKFWIIFLSVLLLMMGSSLLARIFSSIGQMSYDYIMKLITSTNYATGSDLGRFTAIPVISRTILTDWPKRLFGMGLGNCETSSFAICNTPFFRTHEDLHYTWFSSAFLFLETGFIGLGLYLSFFLAVMISAVKLIKSGNSDLTCCQISIIMSIVCMILTFYNSSLRIEVGYVAYFALALPFVCRNEKHVRTLR